jgi:uncharacterized protein
MGPRDALGRLVTLRIARVAGPGAFLAIDDDPSGGGQAAEILLPEREIPGDAREGDRIEVFVYLDSEDRPIATTRPPRLALGEVTFLTVTDLTRFGAFVDWGLPKELLVPHAEQTRELRVGERHPIGLYVDKSGRLAGTMRVAEMLDAAADVDVHEGEWLDGEAWRNDAEIGLFAILERRFVGLVPAFEPHGLSRGQAARFRVSNVLPDGKIELSLRGRVSEEIEGDAEKILQALSRKGAPRVGDRSSPDEIRAVFGLSKKAFKRAVGKLLRERAVQLDAQGFWVAAPPAKP